jgi:hypothetical protein
MVMVESLSTTLRFSIQRLMELHSFAAIFFLKFHFLNIVSYCALLGRDGQTEPWSFLRRKMTNFILKPWFMAMNSMVLFKDMPSFRYRLSRMDLCFSQRALFAARLPLVISVPGIVGIFVVRLMDKGSE